MTAAWPRDRAGASARAGACEAGAAGPGASRLLALALVALVLAACAAPASRPPAGVPRVRHPPPKASVPAARPGGPAVVDPQHYEQDKNRIKQELAKVEVDSLAQVEVGYYMDVLMGRLHQVAANDDFVGRKGDRIALEVLVVKGFEPGSVKVDTRLHEALKPIADVLVEYRKTMVSLRVRTEGADAALPGADLDPQRALAVARYLASAGVATGRIVILGPEDGPRVGGTAGHGDRTRIDVWLEPIVRAGGG